MTTFIDDVLDNIESQKLSLDKTCFILPSQRAGTMLKYKLSQRVKAPIFSPKIISIEHFIEELSGLKLINNIELLFKFYEVYKSKTPKAHTDSFETFCSWAQILLQDFNEIDRYLINEDHIFDYLLAIKEIDHWSLNPSKSQLISNHLALWKNFKTYYKALKASLLEKGIAYQGLLYRVAVENIEPYIAANKKVTHLFLGFNALNTAESTIIQELLNTGNSQIFWDTDTHFLNDTLNNVSSFMLRYKKEWRHYNKNSFSIIANNYSNPKNIKIIGIPKHIGQAKYIGTVLNKISSNHSSLANTAVVLGDESLLIPLLNSLPKGIKTANVTMGLPLVNFPIASFFDKLFTIHKKYKKSFYYKDVIDVIQHPTVYNLFITETQNASEFILNHIQKNNIKFLTVEDLKVLAPKFKTIITVLFSDWDVKISKIVIKCKTLIYAIKDTLILNKASHQIELEALYRFYSLFNQIETFNTSHNYISDIATFQIIYKDLLQVETLDFKGEPLEGLQIMGLLETRVLDFDTVIISGLNEGILPAGKTQNSFIPFDVKIENNLPTYKEKDAVYSYHFFRLLQRAKTIYLLYNTEIDTLKGGEKSRFITQLTQENYHNITHSLVSAKVPVIKQNIKIFKKDDDVINTLKAIAKKGFSPSSLTNYIRNPIDFYFKYVLGIKELDEVEETIAANTLGTIIHNTLEDFYKPLEGQSLTLEHLNKSKTLVDTVVKKHFIKSYKEGDITKGKNRIIYEVSKRYVTNFLNYEIEALQQGNTITILGIEVDNSVVLDIPELNFPIRLKGKVDRIDTYNGTMRIIDYKSGKVLQNHLIVTHWETITQDYDAYSKAFQVLTYALMLHKSEQLNFPAEAGIISFKNLKAGFLKFTKKEEGSRQKNHSITKEILLNFEKELKQLIIEISNKNVDFIEKQLN